MSYCYAERRPFVFTEEGQVMLLAVRDRASVLLEKAGAVRADKLWGAIKGTYEAWDAMAVVDRLVELGDLVPVRGNDERAGQHQLYTGRNAC